MPSAISRKKNQSAPEARSYPAFEQTVFNAANQMSTSGSDTYTYEGDGNLVQIYGRQTFKATYDVENRPLSITRNRDNHKIQIRWPRRPGPFADRIRGYQRSP